MQLRPIQQEAKDATIESFRKGGTYHLMVAPVSFGKTIYSSALMQHCLKTYGARCLFLAHLQELVQQTYDKFEAVAPELMSKTSIFASGLNLREVSDITIGSRQSVARGLNLFDEPVNMIIHDECHLIGEDGEFDKIVNHFLALNPRLRVVGITGTPYRLGVGRIYGEQKRWEKPCFEVGMREMTDQGYLSPIRYKMVVSDKLKSDLGMVKKVAGEYNQGQLANTMTNRVHLGSVKHAIEDYAADRKSIIVFAVNINHGEALAKILGARCVHSRMPKDEWREIVDDFKDGKSRIIVNIGQLSIGFDAPRADCGVLARPTKSPAVYVQQIGRTVRLFEGKQDALVLDLVGNFDEHGSPYDPIVLEKGDSKKDPEYNICPECMELVEPDLEDCPECGACMKEQIEERGKRIKMEQKKLEMREIEMSSHKVVSKWAKKNHITKKGNIGTFYCLKIHGREKPLFRFESEDAKEKRIRKMFDEIVVGERYQLKKDSYGEWITKSQGSTKSKSL